MGRMAELSEEVRQQSNEEWVADYQSEQDKQEQQMAKISDMIESKYLKQADVDDEVVVTISKIGKANIAKQGDEPEYKWMARFDEFGKPMVLNSTNIKRLARCCKSEDTEDWIGKKVCLYVDPDVEFAGNIVGGLRIREYKAAQTTTKKAGDGTTGVGGLDDDIPF